jgi:hypothetical protein
MFMSNKSFVKHNDLSTFEALAASSTSPTQSLGPNYASGNPGLDDSSTDVIADAVGNSDR